MEIFNRQEYSTEVDQSNKHEPLIFSFGLGLKFIVVYVLPYLILFLCNYPILKLKDEISLLKSKNSGLLSILLKIMCKTIFFLL